MGKVVSLLLFLLALLLPSNVFAQQTCLDAQNNPCGATDTACLQQIIDACKNQRKTLSDQIAYMDSQIRLTTLRIDATKTKIQTLLNEINQLENEVQRLEEILTTRVTLLTHRIPASYKRNAFSQFGVLFFSRNLSDLIKRAKYLQTVQQEDASLIFQVKATQNSYNASKQVREDKKTQFEEVQAELVQQNNELASQKQAKDSLLTQTQGQESTYKRLLSEAQARLASFASFADSQGATLLSGQTSCDDWGCYYNQRDNQWGNGLINGQGSGCNGPCTILRVGCLVTSVAMMASHYNHKDISPSDVAFSGPDSFSVGTADLRKGTIYVKGVSITRTTIAGSLSPDLVKDAPVIVGVNYGPFGTHFVVIKSYSNGTYVMNDPYTAGGHDVSFTDHYSLGSVFEVDRVSI